MNKQEFLREYKRARAAEIVAKDEVHRLERVVKMLNQEAIIAYEDRDILTHKLEMAKSDIRKLLKCSPERRCFFCKRFQDGVGSRKCECQNPEWRGTVPHMRERLRKARIDATIAQKTGTDESEVKSNA